jgi:hypothetical protein
VRAAHALRDLRLAHFFRFALGVRDNAARNFMMCADGRVVACDEDNYTVDGAGMDDAMCFEEWKEYLAKIKGAQLRAIVAANAPECADAIGEWRERVLVLRANARLRGTDDSWSRAFAAIDARLSCIANMVCI